MKILITGFRRFATHDYNPSELLLPLLEEKDTKTLLLDVVYEKAREDLLKAIEKEKPDFILSLGLSPYRSNVTLEQYGYNEINSPQPDEEGIVKQGEVIVEGAPRSIRTPIDLGRLQQVLSYEDISTSISADPGRFVCNMVYFLALNSGVPALFAHLPLMDQEPLKEQEEAIKAILKAASDYYGN